MSKNIGFSKHVAQHIARKLRTEEIDAYSQKEEHWRTLNKQCTHQWIVILQKRPKKLSQPNKD